jgi:hypothetical protein
VNPSLRRRSIVTGIDQCSCLKSPYNIVWSTHLCNNAGVGLPVALFNINMAISGIAAAMAAWLAPFASGTLPKAAGFCSERWCLARSLLLCTYIIPVVPLVPLVSCVVLLGGLLESFSRANSSAVFTAKLETPSSSQSRTVYARMMDKSKMMDNNYDSWLLSVVTQIEIHAWRLL